MTNELDLPCSVCDGERTHWMGDAEPCHHCKGTGVEPSLDDALLGTEPDRCGGSEHVDGGSYYDPYVMPCPGCPDCKPPESLLDPGRLPDGLTDCTNPETWADKFIEAHPGIGTAATRASVVSWFGAAMATKGRMIVTSLVSLPPRF